ncbi:MAG: hypothetical protein USCAAHI_02574 [Beijerinckiaceae bacterium]|nr:MAG: hypothetical protein USCAAHI_02574 [Beijerinckiaceae bacterium]
MDRADGGGRRIIEVFEDRRQCSPQRYVRSPTYNVRELPLDDPMAIKSMKDLFLHTLKNICYAERQI